MQPTATTSGDTKTSEAAAAPLVRQLFVCRKCRSLLFTKKHLIERTADPQGMRECTSHYLKADDERTPKYIQQQMSLGVSGKLFCYNQKCKARIGEFNWAGIRSSCGVFITPACRISKGKVEEKEAAIVKVVRSATKAEE
mmetsp:Transcript_25274/g.40548  ORF Transcript_25274/g.40548 Transcript_25274/m.40548 type:complete len:140 (-) Transcript_25274:141-560(-)